VLGFGVWGGCEKVARHGFGDRGYCGLALTLGVAMSRTAQLRFLYLIVDFVDPGELRRNRLKVMGVSDLRILTMNQKKRYFLGCTLTQPLLKFVWAGSPIRFP